MALKRKLRRIRARDGTSNLSGSAKVPDDSETEDTEDENTVKTWIIYFFMILFVNINEKRWIY